MAAQIPADEVFTATETLEIFLRVYREQRLPAGMRRVPRNYNDDPLFNYRYFDDPPELVPHAAPGETAFTISFPATPTLTQERGSRIWRACVERCDYSVAIADHETEEAADRARAQLLPPDTIGSRLDFDDQGFHLIGVRLQVAGRGHTLRSIVRGTRVFTIEVSGPIAATRSGPGWQFIESFRFPDAGSP